MEKRKVGFIIYQAIIYLIFFTFSLGFAYLFNKEIEVIIGIITFFTTRYSFSKTFHCKSTYICLIMSILIFIIFTIICIPIKISIFLNIILGLAINNVLYIIECNNDLKSFKLKEIRKGINCDKLKEICFKNGLNEFETNIMIDYYSKKLSLCKIAIKNNYSVDNIKKIKAKLLKKIK